MMSWTKYIVTISCTLYSSIFLTLEFAGQIAEKEIDPVRIELLQTWFYI